MTIGKERKEAILKRLDTPEIKQMISDYQELNEAVKVRLRIKAALSVEKMAAFIPQLLIEHGEDPLIVAPKLLGWLMDNFYIPEKTINELMLY